MIKDNHPSLGSTSSKFSHSGESFIAKQLINIAQKYGVSLQKNEDLTALLAEVHLHQEIPSKLYLAAAQCFAFLYFLNTSISEENEEGKEAKEGEDQNEEED